jgi:hypothetical protein
VGGVTLYRVYEVGDVDPPKEGRETDTFRETFEDVDVGGVVGERGSDGVHGPDCVGVRDGCHPW